MSDKHHEIRDFVAEGFQKGWKHLDASLLSSDKTLETESSSLVPVREEEVQRKFWQRQDFT